MNTDALTNLNEIGFNYLVLYDVKDAFRYKETKEGIKKINPIKRYIACRTRLIFREFLFSHGAKQIQYSNYAVPKLETCKEFLELNENIPTILKDEVQASILKAEKKKDVARVDFLKKRLFYVVRRGDKLKAKVNILKTIEGVF